MIIRWFTKLDGERVLQFDGPYGWTDVPEESEEDERRARREWEERQEIAAEQARQRLLDSELSYQQRRAMKDFK